MEVIPTMSFPTVAVVIVVVWILSSELLLLSSFLVSTITQTLEVRKERNVGFLKSVQSNPSTQIIK